MNRCAKSENGVPADAKKNYLFERRRRYLQTYENGSTPQTRRHQSPVLAIKTGISDQVHHGSYVLPEFVIVVAFARLADTVLLTRGKPALRV